MQCNNKWFGNLGRRKPFRREEDKRWLEKKLVINIDTERMWKMKGAVNSIGIECKGWTDKQEIMRNKHKLASARKYMDYVLPHVESKKR